MKLTHEALHPNPCCNLISLTPTVDFGAADRRFPMRAVRIAIPLVGNDALIQANRRDRGLILKNMLTMSAGVCVVVASAFAAAIAGPINFTDLLARPRGTATERVHYGDAPSQFADLWMPLSLIHI